MAPADPQPDGGRWGLPLATLVAGMFMVLLDSSIVNIAVPVIQRGFRLDTTAVQWILSLYLVSLGLAAPASGWLADRIGYKRLYVSALAAFTLGSLAAAAAPTYPLLLAGRVVQALGGGMIPPATTAILFRIVPKEQLGVANGYRGIATNMAPALGPTIGGYLVQYVDWRWIFTINLPVGVAGIVLGLLAIPDIETRTDSRFDGWGFATLTAALVPMLLALANGTDWGWQAPLTEGLLGWGLLCLVPFVLVELRIADPLIDLRVLRYGAYSCSLVFSAVLNIAVFGALFLLPLYLEEAHGMGALQVGLILFPAAFATAVMAPVIGRIYDRFDAPMLVLSGALVMGAATYLFHGLNTRTPALTVAWWSVLRGFGLGLCLMPVLTAGISVLPSHAVARAAALRNVVQRVASSFGVAVLTALLAGGIAARLARTSRGAPGAQPGAAHLLYLHAFTQTVDQIFAALAVLLVLSAIPGVFIRGDRGSLSGGAGAARRAGPLPVRPTA